LNLQQMWPCPRKNFSAGINGDSLEDSTAATVGGLQGTWIAG
jgi:hypothetical protein